MKFGKHSPHLFARVGCELPPFPYNDLKRKLMGPTASIFFSELTSLVMTMEKAWESAVHSLRLGFVYLFWRHAARTHRLLAYAELCHEGIRKIVKKYNKRHPDQHWVQNRRLGLLGNSILFKRLQSYAHGYPVLSQTTFECPICLEEKLCGILLVCEHRLCLQCTKNCQRMSAPRTCPLCRLPLILIPS